MAARVPAPLLEPFQIAFLAGRARGACETAIVSLAKQGLLRAQPRPDQDGLFHATGTPPPGAHPLELAVHAAAAQPTHPLYLQMLHSWTVQRGQAREQAGKLNERQRQLIRKFEQQESVKGPLSPGATARSLRYAARPAIGEISSQLQQLGLMRPGFRGVRRTGHGRVALAALRDSYQSLKQNAAVDPVLAAAVWDVRVLRQTQLGEVYDALRPAVRVGDG